MYLGSQRSGIRISHTAEQGPGGSWALEALHKAQAGGMGAELRVPKPRVAGGTS